MRDHAIRGISNTNGIKFSPKSARANTISPVAAVQWPLIFHLRVISSINTSCIAAAAITININLGAPNIYIIIKTAIEFIVMIKKG